MDGWQSSGEARTRPFPLSLGWRAGAPGFENGRTGAAEVVPGFRGTFELKSAALLRLSQGGFVADLTLGKHNLQDAGAQRSAGRLKNRTAAPQLEAAACRPFTTVVPYQRSLTNLRTSMTPGPWSRQKYTPLGAGNPWASRPSQETRPSAPD